MTPADVAALRKKYGPFLARYDRVAIAGGPRTGKSSLLDIIDDRPVFRSDDLSPLSKAHGRPLTLTKEERDREWDMIPDRMLLVTKDLPRFAIEGVMVARALRRGLEVDAVIVMRVPKVGQTVGQAAMQKGIDGILAKLPRNVPWFVEGVNA